MVNNYLAKTSVDLGGAFSSERIIYALEMTALGLIAVFSVLAIIWAVLALFKLFANKPSSKEKEDVKPEKIVEAKVESEDAAPLQPVAGANDDATVAAIIAAISAYISSDEELSREYSGGFRVVSFKRVRDKASWNQKSIK